MKKAGLAYVTECNEDRLTSMMKRQKEGHTVLPFPIVSHQNYTLAEAHELRVVLDLVDNNGIAFSEACYVTQAIWELPLHPLNQLRTEGDLWIGAGWVWDKNVESYWKFKIGGHFDELAPQSQSKLAQEFRECEFVRFVSVNASRAAELVRNRAIALGLLEGDDYTTVSGSNRLGRT